MTVTDIAPPVLFAEPGGRWRSVAYGPLLCLAIVILEVCVGSPVHWFGLVFCAVLLAGFVIVQVVAGRRHVSVELTETTLRQGTETLPVGTITAIYPERDEDAWDDEPWQSGRALGELSGVPRRRTGIGLRLRDGATVQAWARDHRQLRAQLTALLDAADPVRSDPVRSDTAAAGSESEPGTDAVERADGENDVVDGTEER